MRYVHLIIISADYTQASSLCHELEFNIDTTTPQLLRFAVPDLPAAGIGVLIWSTDLQGLKSDIASFASYLVNEDGVLGALQELGIKVSVDGTN